MRVYWDTSGHVDLGDGLRLVALPLTARAWEAIPCILHSIKDLVNTPRQRCSLEIEPGTETLAWMF